VYPTLALDQLSFLPGVAKSRSGAGRGAALKLFDMDRLVSRCEPRRHAVVRCFYSVWFGSCESVKTPLYKFTKWERRQLEQPQAFGVCVGYQGGGGNCAGQVSFVNR